MPKGEYDSLDPYWVVYQYSSTSCPHVFTAKTFDAYKAFLEEVPAVIIAKSHTI